MARPPRARWNLLVRRLAGPGHPPAATTRAALAALGLVALSAPTGLTAQSVSMSGGMGSRALLVINGSAPKALAAGDTHLGVTVLSVGADQAVVQVAGQPQTQTVTLGGSPVNLGRGDRGERAEGTAGPREIVLAAGRGGHFLSSGTVNGRAVQFMVDTGATTVAIGLDEAQRLGLRLQNAEAVRVGTANGVVTAYKVRFDSIRIRGVEVFNVEGTVSPMAMPYVLLGNSFLSRFDMRREGEQLTLTRR